MAMDLMVSITRILASFLFKNKTKIEKKKHVTQFNQSLKEIIIYLLVSESIRTLAVYTINRGTTVNITRFSQQQ